MPEIPILSIPFGHRQEMTDISVLDSIAAHIDFVHRDNVLGEVVRDRIVYAKFALDGFGGGEQIANLNVSYLCFI